MQATVPDAAGCCNPAWMANQRLRGVSACMLLHSNLLRLLTMACRFAAQYPKLQ